MTLKQFDVAIKDEPGQIAIVADALAKSDIAPEKLARYAAAAD